MGRNKHIKKCNECEFSAPSVRKLENHKKIGPDVRNKFTLILLNKNPKIYESVLDKEVNIGQKASDFLMVSQAAFEN